MSAVDICQYTCYTAEVISATEYLWNRLTSQKKGAVSAYTAFCRVCVPRPDKWCSSVAAPRGVCALVSRKCIFTLMLSPAARLRAQSDFDRTYATGTRHYRSGVLLFWRPTSLGVARMACVVGKKTHPRAVARNRQRRILQAACRAIHPSIHASADIIVIYTNRANVLPYKEAVDIITSLCQRANII